MCGILGQISLLNKVCFDEIKFSEALDQLKHRGPDDGDIKVDENFIFGHRRLSIIDLDCHARQPMTSFCGNFILVFNGEIYNYQEIKSELVKKGYIFHTLSDTEVLLNSFIEYGIDCVQQFNGMFAFAIYDNIKKEYYIVRDRLGIKPIYYNNNNGILTFSSEIKSILKLNDYNHHLNVEAVSSYLSFRYPILNDTFFNGIYSLPPAHYIKISESGLQIIEYWNVAKKLKEQKNDKGEKYYLNQLRILLESSVKYRMISDVPIGAFLSGGVDSSIITAIMAENSAETIKTFTIGFEEEGFNEFRYANLIVDKCKTDHKEIILSGENYFQIMERLIEYKDAPLSVPNEVPLYLMSMELKKYITVVLSGEGADEIFGGYGRIFRSPYDHERIKNLESLDLTDKEKRQLSKSFIKKYLVDSFARDIDHFMNIYSYTSFDEKMDLLDDSIDLMSIEEKATEKFMYYFDELEGESYYNKLMYVFEKIHLVGLLNRVDTTTMAASVEARVPFVDHRLVEFAFTIPVKYKLKWFGDGAKKSSILLMSDRISEKFDTPKYILKKAFEDMIPNKVLYRKKMGFPVPLNDWFGGHFNEYAISILLSEEAKNRGVYNINNIERWLNSDRLSKDHNFAMKIWMLINLELFQKKYFN